MIQISAPTNQRVALSPTPASCPAAPAASMRPAAPNYNLHSLKTALILKVIVPFVGSLEGNGKGFGIILYHRVTPAVPGKAFPPLNVTPRRFRQQLYGLLERGYRAWPLRRAIDHHRRGQRIPENVFVVVFDDGFESVYHHAWPVLRELEIPATIFLPTRYLDSPAPLPFDDWAWAGSDLVPRCSWKVLRTDQCHEMKEEGLIDFGSHGHRHEDFRGRIDAFREDLRQSKKTLEDRLALQDIPFALPYGILQPEMTEVVRAEGVSCCLTTEIQLVGADSDRFLWGRFGVDRWDTPATLDAKLKGDYSRVWNAWRRFRPTWLGQEAAQMGVPDA